MYEPGSAQTRSGRRVLTPPAEDFPRWYQEVVAKAELAEGGPVRGTMIIRPYGYAIWERIQGALDARIKALGVQNAYFPLLIPESYLRREKEHVQGFSPELAVVTHGGGKQLEEPLVVRPTSETIIYASFAKWIRSHRDLPLLINQWANVVRWELRPRILLRTTEFLWQEGHTAHASEAEAARFAQKVLREVYATTAEELLAIPVLTGRKTAAERFAGAVTTWTAEAMMGDGKALQMGTSHELGQNFARAFDIGYLDSRGQRQLVWQTSWGSSTRLLGSVIMAHGDDLGLRLPPLLAPIQLVVLVVGAGDEALEQARRLAAQLADDGVRVELDDRVDLPFGRRSVDWELKGIPLRLEVGARELEAGMVTLVERHLLRRRPVALAMVAGEVPPALEAAQSALRAEASGRQLRLTVETGSVEAAVEAAAAGFARLPAPLLADGGEARLNHAGVSVRCLVGDGEGQAVVARAY